MIKVGYDNLPMIVYRANKNPKPKSHTFCESNSYIILKYFQLKSRKVSKFRKTKSTVCTKSFLYVHCHFIFTLYFHLVI
jgi:hypothetical protein